MSPIRGRFAAVSVAIAVVAIVLYGMVAWRNIEAEQQLVGFCLLAVGGFTAAVGELADDRSQLREAGRVARVFGFVLLTAGGLLSALPDVDRALDDDARADLFLLFGGTFGIVALGVLVGLFGMKRKRRLTEGGTATAGNNATATAGPGGVATAGHGGTAIVGNGGTATAGDLGQAVAGIGGTATAGHNGIAIVGGVPVSGSPGATQGTEAADNDDPADDDKAADDPAVAGAAIDRDDPRRR